MSTKIYAEVTARIVAELERGVAPWVKPWDSGMSGYCMPVNAATKRPYRGVNVLALWAAAAVGGYPLPRWLTFRQAHELGGHVRKGEKATAIVLVKSMTVAMNEEDRADDVKRGTNEIHFLRYYSVFNVAQVDALSADLYEPPAPEPYVRREVRAVLFTRAIGADIRHYGHAACYVPALDCIILPLLAAFESPGHYYATLLHELAHWSGHQSRLDRDLSGRFGSQAYAAEELIAELTAAFLCAELGVEGRLRHAEYIGSWLELLHSDMKAIFTAASRASQAADYLRSLAQAPTADT